MSSLISTDEIERRCKDLVIQVAYAFYDTPYIIILHQLMHDEVWQESALASKLQLQSGDLRKYLGKLQVHRLIKRYQNKERVAASDERFRKPQPGQVDGAPRMKEVPYYYIDYREFAQVTKYRLAMIRQGIEESTKNNVGQMGYACPSCGKTFEVLQVHDIVDPATGLLYCDQCGSEVVSYDPSQHASANGTSNADKMQHFNTSMRGIRDALKLIEDITIPNFNINVWIARNVKTIPLPGEEGTSEADKTRYKVVIGDEGDEKERIERERLAEAQRTQNALPVWHTHSTVTGSATALGIKANGQGGEGSSSRRQSNGFSEKDPKRDLAEYYANLADDNEEEEEDDVATPPVKVEPDVKAFPEVKTEPDADPEEDEERDEDMDQSAAVTPLPVGDSENDAVMVMVRGVPKSIHSVSNEDEAWMTDDERQAYEDALTNL